MHGMNCMRGKKTARCTFTIPTIREEVLSNDGTFTEIIIKKFLKNKVKCNYFP
jgi:hypothetical protein